MEPEREREREPERETERELELEPEREPELDWEREPELDWELEPELEPELERMNLYDKRGNTPRHYLDEAGRYMRVIHVMDDHIGYCYFDGVTLSPTLWQHGYLFRSRNITPITTDKQHRADAKYKHIEEL